MKQKSQNANSDGVDWKDRYEALNDFLEKNKDDLGKVKEFKAEIAQLKTDNANQTKMLAEKDKVIAKLQKDAEKVKLKHKKQTDELQDKLQNQIMVSNSKHYEAATLSAGMLKITRARTYSDTVSIVLYHLTQKLYNSQVSTMHVVMFFSHIIGRILERWLPIRTVHYFSKYSSVGHLESGFRHKTLTETLAKLELNDFDDSNDKAKIEAETKVDAEIIDKDVAKAEAGVEAEAQSQTGVGVQTAAESAEEFWSDIIAGYATTLKRFDKCTDELGEIRDKLAKVKMPDAVEKIIKEEGDVSE